MNTVHYVGMDVDKEKIVLARLGTGKDARAVENVIPNTPSIVKKYFSTLLSANEVHATYEAGCFGFALYRQLSAMGVEVVVAAPGLVPRKPSDRIKTDRRDAQSLALALRAGQLTGSISPPSRTNLSATICVCTTLCAGICASASSVSCSSSYASASVTQGAAPGR